MKAIEMNPQDTDTYAMLGMTLYKLNRNEEAISIIKQGLEIDN